MLGLNPTIVEHQIYTWPNAPPIRQKQFLMHPTKTMAIKDEIDELHQE